jgi:GTP 3',8-cyclase
MVARLTRSLQAPTCRTARGRVLSYLRVVVTTRCNHACSYCHAEGDVPRGEGAGGLDLKALQSCLSVALGVGVRKVKLLGGEPLVRPDLCQVVRHVRAAAPSADVSVVTAGVAPAARVDDLLAAGLDRINITFHGFSPEEHGKRIGMAGAHGMREAFVDRILARGRPVKANYVYSDARQDEDLAALLEWAASRRIVVNVLDNLALDGSWRDVAAVVRRLRGEPARELVEHDPDSLPTLQWQFRDGLRVEIKHEQLGSFTPYDACDRCPARGRCREGILALRLHHDGVIRPCMDHPDLRFPLADVVRREGVDAAAVALCDWIANI